MTVAIFFESEVVRMCVLTKSEERRSFLSVSDALQLMLAFSTFTIALIKLVVELIKNDKRK
ncbi:putative holin-like toxin [Tetragenococcus koreensis]|nr:type I toxin-antitoxin system toxin PepG1 [Tetragenococcus koreensis]AYW46587.1 putative holin-like toxin [Tetragenococcus koreensis]MCF1585621.1 putative holin-like toxin [Tetragenococcus koreensis]MCF1615183.1 putative holin-like toxin [Tetragenococcus koreensis]MCF1617890.1 putative holin-like toxin [Tetragenococcus koreensis]MCF1620214.1 putative holin-like toxin [Tetragenococcus koreensis]